MHGSRSDIAKIAELLRKRSDECREMATRAPLYLVVTLPGEPWLLLAEVAGEIEQDRPEGS